MNTFRPPSSGDPREQRIIEALLVAAQRPEEVDPQAEEHAVAAFRLAMLDAGKPERTGRRYDWRRARVLGFAGAWRAALAALVATCALGGAAYATLFALPAHHFDGPGATRIPSSSPSASASAGTSAGPGRPPAGPAAQGPEGPGGPPGEHPSRPGAAHERARCRAYLKDPDKAAAKRHADYHRLVEAAGGEGNVPAYCTAVVHDTGRDGRDRDGKDGKAGKDKPGRDGKDSKGNMGNMGNKGHKGTEGNKGRDKAKAKGKGKHDKSRKPGTPGTDPDPGAPSSPRAPRTPHMPHEPQGPAEAP